jgi:hypothetical protein
MTWRKLRTPVRIVIVRGETPAALAEAGSALTAGARGTRQTMSIAMQRAQLCPFQGTSHRSVIRMANENAKAQRSTTSSEAPAFLVSTRT